MRCIRDLLASADLPGDSGRLDAELLLGHCLGKPRSYLYTWPEKEVAESQLRSFHSLIERRRAGCPVAYLTGHQEFWSLDLQVDSRSLVPRPETETLVSWALTLELGHAASVADLGTGSGAIALALASERPGWTILASDVSSDALALAASNRDRLALANVSLLRAEWGAVLAPSSLDLVVSNPPYVAELDPHLNEGGLPFEPRIALVSGSDGLADIRQIIEQASVCLGVGGWLLLEHGYDQAQRVRDLLHVAGFIAVESRPDLAGIERISGGRKP